jgi:hypothetical protein
MIELNKLCPWSIILSNVSLLCHVYRVRILYSLSIPSHFLHCTVLQRCQSLFAYGYSLDVSNAAKERMRTLTRILAIRLLDVRHVTWYVCDVSHVTCKIHRSYARPRAYHCDSITTRKWVGVWAPSLSLCSITTIKWVGTWAILYNVLVGNWLFH